jgi:hypothetical protein
MVRPVVDDEVLKSRLDLMAERVLTQCIDVDEIRNKPPEYHSFDCPAFTAWRTRLEAARAVAMSRGGPA